MGRREKPYEGEIRETVRRIEEEEAERDLRGKNDDDCDLSGKRRVEGNCILRMKTIMVKLNHPKKET